MTTKQERRAREQSFPKCQCGNTIGIRSNFGATTCSNCDRAQEDKEITNSKLSKLRNKAIKIGESNPELEEVIDLIADLIEHITEK